MPPRSKSKTNPPSAVTSEAQSQDQGGALFMTAFFFAQTGRCQCHACQCLKELAPVLLATLARQTPPGAIPQGTGTASSDHA